MLIARSGSGFRSSSLVTSMLPSSSTRPFSRPSGRDRTRWRRTSSSTVSTRAIEQLSPSQDDRELAMLIRALRRLGREDSEYPVRDQVVRLLKEWTGQSFGYQMGSAGRRAQPEAVQRWTDFVAREHPAGADLLRSARQDIEQRLAELERVDWQRGDPERGARLFERHSCSRCHGGRRALGPDLAGVARRFSREDLFLSIWDPDRDVSPRYQATMVSTHSGHSYTGVVIYQAVDGVTLRDPLNQTIRIEAEEIAAQQRVATSLMPQGLLDDFDPRDYADLYAYLEQLQ
jgi:putative heme-binding domain-containing protein